MRPEFGQAQRPIWAAVILMLGIIMITAGVAAATSLQPAPIAQEETVTPTETTTPEAVTPTETHTPEIASPTATDTPVVETPTATPTVAEVEADDTELSVEPASENALYEVSEINAYVNDHNVFIRQRASQSAPDYRMLPLNTPVILLAKNEDCQWYRVRLEDGLEGWIFRQLITTNRASINADGDEVFEVVSCEQLILSVDEASWAPTPSPTPSPTPMPTATDTPTPESAPADPLPPGGGEAPAPPSSTDWQPFLLPALGSLAVVLAGLLFWRSVQAGWLTLPGNRTFSPTTVAALTRFWPGRGKRGWLAQPPSPGKPYMEGRLASGEGIFGSITRGTTTIGRGLDNDLVIDERFASAESVSRNHAHIEHDGKTFVIVDLKSQNGVYINGRRTQENLLFEGATLTFGQVQFTFKENRDS